MTPVRQRSSTQRTFASYDRLRLTTSASAVWLPDPQDPSIERYWDGEGWTGESRAAVAAAPAQAQSPARAATSDKPRRTRWVVPFLVVAVVTRVGLTVGISLFDNQPQSETSAASQPGVARIAAFEAAAAVPLT